MSGYSRYVAMGDSQTEGLWDGNDTVGLMGFAHQVTDALVGRKIRDRIAGRRSRRAEGACLGCHRSSTVHVMPFISPLSVQPFGKLTLVAHPVTARSIAGSRHRGSAYFLRLDDSRTAD